MGETPVQSSAVPLELFFFLFCGTFGSFSQRSLSPPNPEMHIPGTAVWLMYAAPSGLSLRHLRFGRSSWCVHLQMWPICAPSVNANGGGICSLRPWSLSWSGKWPSETSWGHLRRVSQMANQGWILAVPLVQTLRRGEWD